MSWKEKLVQFRNKYSIENLSVSLVNLIRGLLDSISSSGGIILAILFIPVLIILLVFVRLLRTLKWIITSIFNLLFNIVNFIVKFIENAISLYFSEIGFYLRLLSVVSIWTRSALRYMLSKMLELLRSQLDKLVDEDSSFTTKYEKGYIELSLELTKRLLLWILTVLFVAIMVIGIILIVLIPVSIYIRKKYESWQCYQNDFYIQFYSIQVVIPAKDINSNKQHTVRYTNTIILLILLFIGGATFYGYPTHLLSKGDKASNAGDYVQALNYYQRTFELYPYFSEALIKRDVALEKLISQLLSKGNQAFDVGDQQALNHYQRTLELFPDFPEALVKRDAALEELISQLLSKSNQAFDMGNYIQALRNYRRMLELFPNFPEAIVKRDAALEKLTFQHELKNGGLAPKMIIIPKGSFKMGDIQGGGRYSEKPAHEVTIDYDFAMSQYEVTFAEYDKFCEATAGCEKPSDEGWGRDNRPVINVSWHDAKAYAEWLSVQTGYEYRLPTEAEWEYAARAGTETKYWWSNMVGRNNANCDGCGSQWDNKQTAPVGSFKANSFGLYDMNGNIWEWCEDSWHENYVGAPTDGSARKKLNENRSVVRGGSWYSYAYNCRSAVRGGINQNVKLRNNGIRLVFSVQTYLGETLMPKQAESEKNLVAGEIFQLKLKDGSLAPKMVVIPKGSFRMGDIQGGGNDSEKPVHKVTINYDFAMSQYEVTKGEFAQFIKATNYQTDAEKGDGCYGWTGSKWEQKKEFNWRNAGFEQENNHPVVCMSWNDAKAYAKWLSEQTGHECRLPTEAEWEYAARAGTETKYWWGNKASHEYMNYSGDTWGGLAKGKDKWKYTSPVGSFKANPFGLYDMNGNVWEWCEDSWHDNYKGAPTDGSAWKNSNENRSLLRGGSWNVNALNCRSAYRFRYDLGYRLNNLGVRLVCGVRA